MNYGIYIHIPFCRGKCDYCSFYSIAVNEKNELIDFYVNTLLEEIDFITGIECGVVADTVYIGGGTPSILGPARVDKLLNHISKRFILSSEREITIEMNPDDIGEEKLKRYSQAGINRIVLGIQSLNVELRERIGRKGKLPGREDLDIFFSQGEFIRCIDFMAGLPGQSLNELIYDLDTVAQYRPQHISLYLLSVDCHTPLGLRFLPDDKFEKNQTELWGCAMEFLNKKGYIHYEISNYSLPGFESRHNSKYWDLSPYFGFGSGAHSFINNVRRSNQMGITDFINSGNFIYKEEISNSNSLLVEFIMTSLRRIKGFSGEEFKSATGSSLPDHLIEKINFLKARGLLEVENGRCFLSKQGLYFADNVIYQLVEDYL